MEFEVCTVDSIAEGHCKDFSTNNSMAFFGVKKRGKIYLYLNRCPHYGTTPLNWGPDDFLNKSTDLIQCSGHGALFNIEDGECIQGPCLGSSLIALEYEIRNNKVFIEKSKASV